MLGEGGSGMAAKRIFTGEEAARAAMLDAERRIHTNVLATGEHMQLVWARYEPGAEYTLHTHEHEQFSVLLQGRMLLTVGDEVREIGPEICGTRRQTCRMAERLWGMRRWFSLTSMGRRAGRSLTTSSGCGVTEG